MIGGTLETTALRSLGQAYQAAVRCHQAGDLDRAAGMYEQILRRQPEHAGAWHLWGVTHLQSGRPAQAVECIERAIAMDAGRAVFFGNLGVALRALGRRSEALAALKHAVALRPQFSDAWGNLGLVLQELDRPDEAVVALKRAIELVPNHADALYNLANLTAERDGPERAIPLYRRAAQAQPQRADIRNNLGNAMLAHGQPAEAIACYQQAIGLQADYGEAHLNLGTALAAEDQTDEAAGQFAVAARLRPDRPLWALRETALCPPIFASVEELEEYRANLESRLDGWLSEPIRLTPDELLTDAFVPSFNLAHHGRCNRRLMEKFAALFAPSIPRREARVKPGRLRIGFVVTPPHEGGFLRAMAGVVTHLNAPRFQPVVICASAAIPACRRAIGRDDIEWIGIPRHYSRAAQLIAEARCHLLYYRKATADPLGYLLAMTRLAPVQCTSWGTHLTSGIAQIDYYVSSALIESDGADAQYAERLVRLNTIPSFEARPASHAPAARSQFGLPENGHLYLCPQRLAKFHPAHDALFRQLLEADPDGYLVLIRPENREHVIERLLSRFRRTLGRVARRVLFVPPQKPAAFRGLLSAGDVLLDLPHYGVSLMAYDALAKNLPIVTWPGRLKVERYGLAFHRKLDWLETVASSAEEYVGIALRVATDRDFREHLRREIEVRKHVLFEDPSVVREHERFFEEVIVS